MKNPNGDLNVALQAAVDRNQITEFKSESTGNKLIWTIGLPEASNELVDGVGANLSKLETKEVKIFLAGLALGGTGTKVRAARALKANPLRDAIAKDGRVEYKVEDPADQKAMKAARNKLFSLAYTLGYKNHFKVTTHEGGVLIGEVNPEVFNKAS